MKHVTTMSRNCMTRALSITLILGLLLSSLAFSPNLSEIFNTNVWADTDGYWNDYTDTTWYYDNQNENENEYTITTAEELAGLAKLVNDETDTFAGKFIQLTDDIDLGEHEWVPIGLDDTKSFKGNFDGQNHSILNMHIGTSEAPANYKDAGLFGFVNADMGKTIFIENVNINKTSWVYSSFSDNDAKVGGICGFACVNVIINNCSNSGKVCAVAGDSGGICGQVRITTISNCINSGTVSTAAGPGVSGGICGSAYVSTIDNCNNNGKVSKTNNFSGGICGYAATTVITNCINHGTVQASEQSNSFLGLDSSLGGICGQASDNSTIECCTNKGTVQASEQSNSSLGGNSYLGGICGQVCVTKISNCTNHGTVQASEQSNSSLGGICGYNSGGTMINYCINSGTVSTAVGNIGGICGYDMIGDSTISNCYYKEDITATGIGGRLGQINPDDQPGETTALPESQMTAASVADGIGEGDWVNITVNNEDKGRIPLVYALNYGLKNSEYIWTQKDGVNNNCPYMYNSWTLIGTGNYPYINTEWYDNNVESDDYTINTAEELAGLAKLVNSDGIDFTGVTITLGDNINLSAHDWEPIGTQETPFKGTFDGNNKTISGMRIYALENQKQLGLFGNVESGTIKNVNIDKDCYISTYRNTASAGGICGYASDGLSIHEKSKDNEEITTTIINCSSKATIITNSKSLSQIGGIVGATSGVTINNCHNMGSVKVQSTSKENTGEHNVGGIVGYCVGATDIIGCINEGDVLSSVNGNAFARAGGIVGASSYTPSIGTTKIETIVDIGVVKIKNCQNFGNVESNCIYNKLNLYDDPYYTENLDTEDDRKLFLSSIEDNELFSSYAGGIIGELGEKTEVTNCISLGTVKANTGHSSEVKERETDDSDKIRTYAGGICGGSLLDLNELKIENCAFGGNVEATTDLPNQISDTCAGGIYGKIETEANATITISNCYYKKGAAATGIANEVDQAGEITALPETQMTAAEGTIDGEGWVDITLGNIQEKMALVDALNTWVRAYNATNPSVEALGWKVTTGSYPTLNPNQNIASTEINTAADTNAPADEGANDALGDESQTDETQTEETQAANGNWSEYTNTAWYDENKNEYSIGTAEELAGLAQLVNDGTDEFADKTIKLTNDIDLGDHYWVPIGDSDYAFQGTFDGQGRTIKNMKIGEQSKPASYDFAAFFGAIENATVENVTIGEGSYVYSSVDAAGICAISEDSTIKNCINRAVEISSASEQEDAIVVAGGIVSQVSSGKTEIIDCVNYSKISANSYRNTDRDAASSGGIVGFIKYYKDYPRIYPQLSISKCINYGDVTSTSSAGGICGYATTDETGDLTINDSINVGEISAVLLAGGLIGGGKPSSSIINNTYYKKWSVTAKYKEQNRAIGNAYDAKIKALSEDKIEEKANELLAEIKERNKDISTETNTAADTNAPANEGANTDEEVAAALSEMRVAIPSTGQNAGAQEGWQQIGDYIYYYKDGAPLTNQWQRYNNLLVYLGQSGSVINIFGYLENNNWVYYEISQNSCNRITGFRQIGNRQFYFSNGTLIANKGWYNDTTNGTEIYVDNNANVIFFKGTNGLYYTFAADGTLTLFNGEVDEADTGNIYVFNQGRILNNISYMCAADGKTYHIGAIGANYNRNI